MEEKSTAELVDAAKRALLKDIVTADPSTRGERVHHYTQFVEAERGHPKRFGAGIGDWIGSGALSEIGLGRKASEAKL